MLICTIDTFAKVFGAGWAAGIITVVVVLVIAARLERK